MRELTNFEAMWASYPNPGEGAAAAKATIGGEVDAPFVTNTCVVRLSRAMNDAGHPIPKGFPALATLRGADGKRYALRVAEMRRYLRRVYGPPAVTHTYSPPGGDVPETLRGRRGILCFVVDGWSDATGHFDLWNGERCLHAAYFAEASSVQLWEVASGDGATTGPDDVPALSGSVGQRGARNDPADVRVVQQLLLERGEDPGPVDGRVGPRTVAAIRRFQRAFLKRPDGRVDPGGRTWRALHLRD